MYCLRKCEITALEIAGYLNKEFIGEDFIVKSPYCIKTPSLLEHVRYSKGKKKDEKILLITDKVSERDDYSGHIISNNPELDLAYILREFFTTMPIHEIHKTANISDDAIIGRNVKVGVNSCVGPDVNIGDNTIIMNNVVINGPVNIGKSCVIKDGVVIGSEGWNFVMDEMGNPFHVPQIGKIMIGDQVWLGSNTTIERAMLIDTIISSHVKIDDLVHIGAGSLIDTGAMITAGTVVGYNVMIGKHVKIAPNTVIRENIEISDGVVIGLGAVVVKNLTTKGVYIGNPARLQKGREEIGHE